jgi:prepilin-type N-terminal cleavage/methylation domain-containing protein
MHKQKGFTLLEMLLSIAIMAILLGMGAPLFQSFNSRNNLDVATVETVQTLRRAQMLAQASDGDTSWGVHIVNGSLTLFQGTSYNFRTILADELFEIPTSFTISGLSDVLFTKFSGIPQNTGIITITSPENETRTITINSKGTISY